MFDDQRPPRSPELDAVIREQLLLAETAILPEVLLLLQNEELTGEEIFQFVSARLLRALGPAEEE